MRASSNGISAAMAAAQSELCKISEFDQREKFFNVSCQIHGEPAQNGVLVSCQVSKKFFTFTKPPSSTKASETVEFDDWHDNNESHSITPLKTMQVD
ncbi:MAG: hypothetical protein ACRCUY_13285 [Thermoguttaceae bacterium]